MKTRRFIKSVLKTSKTEEVSMPWARGSRREEFVAKRTTKPLQLKSA